MRKDRGEFEATSRRTRCLLILPRSVFPTVCGYAIKNKNVLELLNREYDLTLVVMKETAFTPAEEEYYRQHSRNCHLWVRTRLQSYVGTLFALLTGKALQVGYYYDRRLQRLVDQDLQSCDVAVAVLERTVEYLRKAPAQVTRVFDMVDSIALNYQRSRERTTSAFWKLLYGIEGGRLLKLERKWVTQADITYFINQEECEHWRPYGKVRWLPHGVNPELLSYTHRDPSYQNGVAFIGKMDYQPNVDAMMWYIKNVHARLNGAVPLYIVGASPAPELSKLAQQYPDITITGYLDDPYFILNSVMALVAPMQTGGGIQNKVLEGMALGKINIITPLAAKPIVGGVPGEHFLVAETGDDFVARLHEIQADPQRYADVGEKARELVRKVFSWESYDLGYLDGIRESCEKR